MKSTTYTLHQRRLKEQLSKARNLDDLKAFLEKTVIGDPAVVSDFSQKTVEEVRDKKRELVWDEFKSRLAEGFTDANGVTWAGTDDARGKMLELASGLGISDRLPKGRSSIALKDANGTPRNLNKAEVKGLAEDALDFKHDAESNRDRLLAEIDAATTHGELDAIDPASGWPT